MKKKEAVEKLTAWLLSQVGYHESGDNNTVYADTDYDTSLYGFDMHGAPWCDFFVDFAFIKCFGYDAGTAMTYQRPSGSAACEISANYYKDNKAYFQTPEVGDQVFFYCYGGINHTGVVVDVLPATIVTVEGNSGDAVQKNTYYKSNPTIAGYGRPNWSILEEENEEEPEDLGDIVHPKKRRNHVCLQQGDGIRNPLPRVRAWQNHLIEWGFGIEADGEFGPITEEATRAWQELAKNEYGADVEINGVVDTDDWEEIILVPVE